MDVYGFNLSTEQYTGGFVQLYDKVDGAPARLSVIQIGWEVSIRIYTS
jgi:hypothetical protein